jgi:hypothetical protein
MKVTRVGPSGLVAFVGDSHPYLTVGAISWRPLPLINLVGDGKG